jgi:hypothetical protein
VCFIPRLRADSDKKEVYVQLTTVFHNWVQLLLLNLNEPTHHL